MKIMNRIHVINIDGYSLLTDYLIMNNMVKMKYFIHIINRDGYILLTDDE